MALHLRPRAWWKCKGYAYDIA